ncbi:thioredoxin F2, chloroplastic-like [Iris pallida]|uniref:Thioredoxin F2, chloroplastic-like n=1 Tax=Iris pallida TaxID=29817 RepID=A0AAX6FXC7_IRIPA|nr:thioredoxin F2, chloroplastic-like [Iris pallida]
MALQISLPSRLLLFLPLIFFFFSTTRLLLSEPVLGALGRSFLRTRTGRVAKRGLGRGSGRCRAVEPGDGCGDGGAGDGGEQGHLLAPRGGSWPQVSSS